MQAPIRVGAPPSKPVLIYDGECRFCRYWIRRWQAATGELVEYVPYQDGQVAVRFPEIPGAAFEVSVQLVLADGRVFYGAEAVVRALSVQPHYRWMLDGYERSAVLARIAEASYAYVARHRSAFSRLTRLFHGSSVEPPDYRVVRWVFLRLLGLIYLIAFWSLWVQIDGLVGSSGIEPARLTMESARQVFPAEQFGPDRFRLFPTLCWFSADDRWLHLQCEAGMIVAVLVTVGIAPVPCLFLLWLIYLSLSSIAGVFLQFQWDTLLLETGFLAIFFAPIQLLPRLPSRETAPSAIVLWLFRWLVFRLMFESGCVKLLSGDPSWRSLTALTVHYETQPLPTWVGWYAHQLPLWIQKADAGMMFGIELVLPFLIFVSRRTRQVACAGFAALQVIIMVTGNYGFFNVLALALGLALLDDAAIGLAIPRRFAARVWNGLVARIRWKSRSSPVAETPRGLCWPVLVTGPLAVLVGLVTTVQVLGMFSFPIVGSHPLLTLHEWIMPFRSINSYGLFAVMTTTRPEIVIEGSNDGSTWREYGFKYQTGDIQRAPRFVAPHQPRLDWQMWFAALGDYRRNPWFVKFAIRLLQGSPQVLALLERNPFPDGPPRYVRAMLYEYRFTSIAERRRTGVWWVRQEQGTYLPAITLKERTDPGIAP